jgi:hypothetical protein
MEQEQSHNPPSTYPPSLSLPQSDNGVDFGQVMAMFQQGIPTIDKIPVESTYCQVCEQRSPRIHVMGFSAVVCPDCKRVYVDEK